MRSGILFALAASLSTSAAVYQGFNYGSTQTDGSFKQQSDFESEFATAKALVGTSGFSSARLYTMIQGGSSTNEPTSAIPAAIAQDTTLLLGLWASGGQGGISGEIAALKTAISLYGTAFTSRVAGISVGSEDLYRISPTGVAAKAGIGAGPDVVINYISQVRAAIKGTALSAALVGHVDTWTAWVDPSNSAVASACDWIGMDAYPYFQNTMTNSIDQGASLFNAALAATQQAVGGKPVWITETGWPVGGSTSNLAVPSTANAKTYWDQVGCPNFGKVNTWWFTLQDADPVTPNPSFGIVGYPLSDTPLYDLSCSAVSSSTSSAPSTSTTSTPSIGSGTGSGSSSASSASTSASVPASVSSSVSSAASSLSSAAAGGAVASSGGGLSPSQGAGNGVGSANTSTTGAVPVSTGASRNGSSAATGASSTLKPSASSSGTSTTPLVVGTNAANVLSGSVVGAMGALFAAVAAL